jgi:hypothetical protein
MLGSFCKSSDAGRWSVQIPRIQRGSQSAPALRYRCIIARHRTVAAQDGAGQIQDGNGLCDAADIWFGTRITPQRPPTASNRTVHSKPNNPCSYVFRLLLPADRARASAYPR